VAISLETTSPESAPFSSTWEELVTQRRMPGKTVGWSGPGSNGLVFQSLYTIVSSGIEGCKQNFVSSVSLQVRPARSPQRICRNGSHARGKQFVGIVSRLGEKIAAPEENRAS